MKAVAKPDKRNREYQVACKPVRVYQGRIRFNIEEFFNNGNNQVKNFLGKLTNIPAITRVKFSSVSKTVVIHYTPDNLKSEEILRRVIHFSPTQENEGEAANHLEILMDYTINKKGGDLELLKINCPCQALL